MKLRTLLASGLAVLGASLAANAQLTFLNFDSAQSGTPANFLAPGGISFYNAVQQPLYDRLGDPIPGTLHWEADLNAGDVLALNPQVAYDRGGAPSQPNALDAVFSPVLLQFDQPINLMWFSTVLDNDRFGTQGLQIEFYGSRGGADVLLGGLTIDQTMPGYQAELGSTLNDVSKIVFPAGALYDDIALGINAVPEPGPVQLIGLGAAGWLWLTSRRKENPA